MSKKRGGGAQSSKFGDFEGNGAEAEVDDTPVMASAAVLAARKAESYPVSDLAAGERFERELHTPGTELNKKLIVQPDTLPNQQPCQPWTNTPAGEGSDPPRRTVNGPSSLSIAYNAPALLQQASQNTFGGTVAGGSSSPGGPLTASLQAQPQASSPFVPQAAQTLGSVNPPRPAEGSSFTGFGQSSPILPQIQVNGSPVALGDNGSLVPTDFSAASPPSGPDCSPLLGEFRELIQKLRYLGSYQPEQDELCELWKFANFLGLTDDPLGLETIHHKLIKLEHVQCTVFPSAEVVSGLLADLCNLDKAHPQAEAFMIELLTWLDNRIKAPKSRQGAGARTPGRPMGAPFNNISGNAGQPNGDMANGGMNNDFQAQAQGAGFNFGQSSGASNAGFGNSNGGFQGYSGSTFHIPPSENQHLPAANTNNTHNFFAPPTNSSFNFGGPDMSQNFAFGQPAQNATPNGINHQEMQAQPGGMFGSTSGPSGLFGSQPAENNNMFSMQTPQQTSSIFGTSTNVASAPEQTSNLFGMSNNAASAPQQTSNIFGMSNNAASAPQQTSNFFSMSSNAPSTPQPTSNIFGMSNNTSSAPQTEPVKPATTQLIGTPAPQQENPATTNPFGGASATPSNPLFGATAPASEQADQSMISPENKQKTPSNLFGNIAPAQSSAKSPFSFGQPNNTAAASSAETPSAPTSSGLFGGFGQPKTTETPSSAATPSAPASSSTSADFRQPKTTKASSSDATPSAPASSSTLDQSQSAADPQATSSTASETPAKPNNLFGSSSFQRPSGGLFAVKPKASKNMFGPSSAATAPDASTPLPWNRHDDLAEPKPDSQAATANIFAPKSSESSANSQPNLPSSSSLFGTSSSFQAGATPKPAEQPATQPQERVNIFNAPATSMSTLNSAASPTPTPEANLGKGSGKLFNVNPPAPPSHFTEEQKHQFFYAYQLKSLDACVRKVVREYPDLDREAFFRYAKQEQAKLVASLKRRRAEDDDLNEEAPPAKRANTETTTPISNPSANPLFSSRVTNPNQSSGSGLFAAVPSKSATSGASSSASNPFSVSTAAANPFASSFNSNKRKSDDATDRKDADGSPESGKRSKTDDQVSYPKLPESSSKTSQLFARVSNGPTDNTPVQSGLFQSTSSNTPSGSPTKAASAAGSSAPLFSVKDAASSSSTPTFAVKPPSFGAPASGTNFLSQFGASAKKTAEAEAKKRKDADYDSDEETEEQWAKRDKEEQEKKQAELAAAANSSGGFVFKATTTPSSGNSPFKLGGASDKPAATPALFGAKSTAEKPAEVSAATPRPAATPFLFGANSTTEKPAEASAATPKPVTGGLFGNTMTGNKPSSSTPGGASLFDTPPKPASPFGNSFFSSSTTKDNTFKGDSNTPLKFSTSTTPAINFTAPSPQKAPATNGAGLFSKSQPIGGAPSGGIFAKNNALGSSLAPASVTSDTSRATSPGTTGDEGEEEGPKDAQLDLAGAVAGEEDEDVLFDIKAKASTLMLDPKQPEATTKTWVTKGVGQLKLLRHKTSSQCRVVLRSIPAGKVMLNANLVPSVTYKQEQAAVRFAVATGKTLEPWALRFKNPADAATCSELMEENKSNV